MRRLMWFAIGFAAACGLCAYFFNEQWTILFAVAVLACGLLFGILGRERLALRRAAYALMGCAMGLFWFLIFRGVYLLSAISLDGETVKTTITATDYSYETGYGSAVDGRVELEGKSYQIRLYVNEKWEIEPGDRIEGEFRFRITIPDGEKEATYHQGKGIFLLGYQVETAELIRTVKRELEDYPSILARQIKSIIRSCFPEDTFGFAQALLLGDSTELDYETETAFKISGIRHIIAVSGLHISIFYGMISTITFKRRYLSALIGIPVLLLFAAVAGFTPSVTRACIMVLLMILASLFNKEYDGATALGFACLVMLIVNPLTITSVGFQLSAGSVAGIFLFQERVHNWLKSIMGEGKGRSIPARLNRWFCSSVSVTLSAMSITTPLCAWYFGTVSLVGIAANLLCLWVVSFLFCGIMAVCLLSLISMSVAAWLAGVVSWGIRYILWMSRWLSAFPLAAVYTKSIYVVFWLILVYILLAVFLFSRERKPGVLICCGCLGLCLALTLSWMEPLSDKCRVTVLDVGQGQCILLQSSGKTYLVDCGGDNSETASDIAAETLLSQGVTRLDGIILTHYDSDHAGGVANLLTRIDTELLILPDTEDGGVAEELLPLTGGQVIWVYDDVELNYEHTTLKVFGPIYSGDSNENSLCVLFTAENCDILITGDRSAFGERMLLRERELPQVELLIAGHHGSKFSTSTELLEAVRPETVIISVGENSYGHPAPEVLQRLAEFGCRVYRTDENGTIIYRR